MSDNEEERPEVSTSQNTTAASAAHAVQHSMQNALTASAAHVVQHSTHGPKDIRMHAFLADSDPDETGRRWKKWRNELLTRFRYFRISRTQDRVDVLHIYGGEQIRELIESLRSVPTPPSAQNLNEYEKIITKLDNHFIPMVNPDCARSKLEKMCQNEGESVTKYHVHLRLQVAVCFHRPGRCNPKQNPANHARQETPPGSNGKEINASTAVRTRSQQGGY